MEQALLPYPVEHQAGVETDALSGRDISQRKNAFTGIRKSGLTNSQPFPLVRISMRKSNIHSHLMLQIWNSYVLSKVIEIFLNMLLS